ncbi:MAG TPA: ParB/RepB/Spo0J family partition protein [Clostridiaceae bacterium]|nr:ParB/RepB/Spo0J family partition protein [Clostridiaceae bacterium]
MGKKFGLGKGLGALIPEEEGAVEQNASKKYSVEANMISINLIKPNEGQPRKTFDEEKILQLSESIKEHGIIQPILLKKDGENYSIIAGERRWRAAKAAGLKEVPVIVMDIDEKSVLEVSLIENIQRQDLNPIEEAWAFRKLIDDFSFTQEELGKRIGKSRTALANTMRLLNLDPRVQEYLIDGVISEGHGRAILAVEDKDLQNRLAQKVIDDGLTVREIEKLIADIAKDKNNDEKPVKKGEANPYISEIKNRLEEKFDTKVLISNRNNKGKIEIEYYSNDDLQRIMDILSL